MTKEAPRAVIPKPAVVRLSNLCVLLENMEEEGRDRISSAEIGRMMGVPSHTIRKDISYLEQAGTGSGYYVSRLKKIITEHLGFDKYRKACIVGMGRLGSVIVTKNGFYSKDYKVVAGFDINTAKFEKTQTDIPLYHSDNMNRIIRELDIKIGIITVPEKQAQKVADMMIGSGIKGIINFSPKLLENKREDVFIRNIFIAGEFHILSALISQSERE